MADTIGAGHDTLSDVADDLRHTHKTWLIEDGIPEITKARRLGTPPRRHSALTTVGRSTNLLHSVMATRSQTRTVDGRSGWGPLNACDPQAAASVISLR
ncbi:hypothetical protein ABZV78_00960 [Micromonospora sp. NPDC004540]|uniref:hypothetical protein n=1 Tax=Micromonospora sp. NPDC004540 TaxID=3154457 RepID=UPI0033A6CFAB